MADSKLSDLTATTTLQSTDEAYVNDGGTSKKITIANLIAQALSVHGVTASASEINFVDGSVAGTAVASKALVLGATKNIDTIDVTKDGLKIGGVAVTTTAAELNVLDGIPAGLTATEVGYLDGVTSAIQTQLDAKVTATTDQVFNAWVMLDGTGTVSITDDYGVASITDVGTGQYRITLDSAQSGTTYPIFTSVEYSDAGDDVITSNPSSSEAQTTTTFLVETFGVGPQNGCYNVDADVVFAGIVGA